MGPGATAIDNSVQGEASRLNSKFYFKLSN